MPNTGDTRVDNRWSLIQGNLSLQKIGNKIITMLFNACYEWRGPANKKERHLIFILTGFPEKGTIKWSFGEQMRISQMKKWREVNYYKHVLGT